MGISKYALSQMYKYLDVSDIVNILQGDYLFYSLNEINFEEKDIDILYKIDLYIELKKEAEEIINRFKDEDVILVYYYDEDYPFDLRRIKNPPFLIFIRGDYKILNEDKKVSIVGSRHISPITENTINYRVKELVDNSFITVSGLAFGTDITVHRETYNNNGKTIAVLPSSIFRIQPKAHKEDVNRILLNGGAVISEYYKDDQFSKSRYIDRNRIVSGLSKTVILTEFEEKSGTMHTARFAWKQKRKIFCFDNQSSGIQKILNTGEGTVYEGVSSLI